MVKIHFIRFNVSWGPLFLSRFATKVAKTVLDDVDCFHYYWEMLDNIAGRLLDGINLDQHISENSAKFETKGKK